jgi:hypothetical protein
LAHAELGPDRGRFQGCEEVVKTFLLFLVQGN